MSKEEENAATMNQAILQLAAHIKQTKPYLFEIDKAITDVADGIVRLEVRVYHGEVTDVVVTNSKRLTFSKKK